MVSLLLACGGDSSSESAGSGEAEGESIPELPPWRYVNNGWVSPHDAEQAGAFAQQLRAFVITNQEEMDQYNSEFTSRQTRGTTASLGRIEFPQSVALAAYYLWRPYQGDPLSVVGFSLEGDLATVQLEIEESPQGRARPYLLAPMIMVALDRSILPGGQPIEFVFQLDGQTATRVLATID